MTAAVTSPAMTTAATADPAEIADLDIDSYVNFPGFTLCRDKTDVRSACCPAPSTAKAIGACPTTSPG